MADRNQFMRRINGNGEYRKPQYSQASKVSLQKRAGGGASDARERSLSGNTRSKGSVQARTKSKGIQR